MAKKQSVSIAMDQAPDANLNRTGRLRALIKECAEIPKQVTEAEFARVDERLIDDRLISMITQSTSPESDDKAQAALIQRRSDALSPYIGRSLVCVLIKLPGVAYTIEVDPSKECIVHWEWQTS